MTKNCQITLYISNKKRNTDYFTKTPYFKPTFQISICTEEKKFLKKFKFQHSQITHKIEIETIQIIDLETVHTIDIEIFSTIGIETIQIIEILDIKIIDHAIILTTDQNITIMKTDHAITHRIEIQVITVDKENTLSHHIGKTHVNKVHNKII